MRQEALNRNIFGGEHVSVKEKAQKERDVQKEQKREEARVRTWAVGLVKRITEYFTEGELRPSKEALSEKKEPARLKETKEQRERREQLIAKIQLAEDAYEIRIKDEYEIYRPLRENQAKIERLKMEKKEGETVNKQSEERSRSKEEDAGGRKKEYEKIRDKEQEDFARVQEILKKKTLNEGDIQTLRVWMSSHREYGMAEMTDDEYYDLFCDGRFYFHSSNFFRVTARDKSKSEMPLPRFVEALKDGHLMGGRIGDRRGEYIPSGITYKEDVVFFDDQISFFRFSPQGDIFTLRNDLQSGDGGGIGGSASPGGGHIGYAVEQKNTDEKNIFGKYPPVVLITPARVLEAHSVKEPKHFAVEDNFLEPIGERVAGKSVGIHEGVAFGSGNPDAWSSSHNIDLGLFVLVLPRVRMPRESVSAILANIADDPRFQKTPISRLVHAAISRIPQGGVDLEAFMRDIFSRAQGIKQKSDIPAFPRLYFYDVSPSSNQERDVKNGLCEFLDTHGIETNISKKLEPDQAPQAFLPEQYRINARELDGAANNVRIRLRQERITIPSLQNLRESQDKLTFTREDIQQALQEKDMPNSILALLEREFGSLDQHVYGFRGGPLLKNYIHESLQRYEKYRKFHGEASGVASHELLTLVVALHAIGIPQQIKEGYDGAHLEGSYVYSAYASKEILQKLGFTEKEIMIAISFFEEKNVIKRYLDSDDGIFPMDNSIYYSAEKAGISHMEWYAISKVLYLCTGDDGKYFAGTDPRSAEVAFTQEAEKKLKKLEDVLREKEKRDIKRISNPEGSVV